MVFGLEWKGNYCMQRLQIAILMLICCLALRVDVVSAPPSSTHRDPAIFSNAPAHEEFPTDESALPVTEDWEDVEIHEISTSDVCYINGSTVDMHLVQSSRLRLVQFSLQFRIAPFDNLDRLRL